MQKNGSSAVIVDAVRTPVGKAPRGSLRGTRPDDLAAQVLSALVERTGIDGEEIDDVVLGCAFPEAEQGMNMARIAALRAGLSEKVSGMTINRFCSSGLQSIALACQSIESGSCETVIAGGAESMSLVPMEGYRFSPNPALVANQPNAYLSMGLTAENLTHRFSIPREAQDRFALRSHQNALNAQTKGIFEAEIVPVAVSEQLFENGEVVHRSFDFRSDEGPRADTSLEALSTLRPVFHARGSVTAGNSSQRSDGAAAALVTTETLAASRGLRPLGRLLSFATAGVAPEIMGIGPVHAVPRALKQAGLELKDIGLVELNEAFAAQALAVIQELDVDPEIVNVNGGAIALGHPLGATGAKLTATLLHEMERRHVRYGLVTMCVGGGMGAAGVLESLRT